MHVPYITEIFDPFLNWHSAEEHHSDHIFFWLFRRRKDYKEANAPERKAVGSVFPYPIEALLSQKGEMIP